MITMDALNSALTLREEASACFLCADAPCTAACPCGVDAARAIRSARFENLGGAANHLPTPLPCDTCETRPCLAACLKTQTGRGVAVDTTLRLIAQNRTERSKASLAIKFCGIPCENPYFLSSSIVANDY